MTRAIDDVGSPKGLASDPAPGTSHTSEGYIPGWQPIASAPRDGTRIRARLANGHITDAEYWGGFWAIDATPAFIEDDFASLESPITHWRLSPAITDGESAS